MGIASLDGWGAMDSFIGGGVGWFSVFACAAASQGLQQKKKNIEQVRDTHDVREVERTVGYAAKRLSVEVTPPEVRLQPTR